jgi:chemotaxis family two-component system response regulator Rcp1
LASPIEEEKAVRILIVEDNPADAYMTQLALEKEMRFESTVVDDGAPAIAYLKTEPPYQDAPRPDLIILDLNLKMVDGIHVLRWIRKTPGFNHMPVVVLSSSPADAQRDAATQASCYLQKPGTLDEFMAIGRVIRNCLESAHAS